MPLEILYQDAHIVAINKPHGLLVHRTRMASEATEFALQQLRDMLGQSVYPAHRLDRKTSGVLLFALAEKTHKLLQKQFAEGKMEKTYWSIVRGFTEIQGTIEYALTNDAGKNQEATTAYKTLQRVELDVPYGKHDTSRYSFIEVYPKTGRMHQIRKHMAHIFHPIIADRTHGCNKQNRLFKEKWNMETMLLHARKLCFTHPITEKRLEIEAGVHHEFTRMMELMKIKY